MNGKQLWKKGKALLKANKSSAIEYLKQAVKAFEEENNYLKAGECCIFIGEIFELSGNNFGSLIYQLRARHLLIKYGLKNNVTEWIYDPEIFREQMDLYEKLIETSKIFQIILKYDYEFAKNIADLILLMGDLFWFRKDYSNAMEKYNEARKYFKKNKLYDEVACSDFKIGKVLFRLESYQKALKKFKAARKYYKSKGLIENIVSCDFNIGSTLNKIGEYQKALKLISKAKKFYESNKQFEEAANCNLTIGSIMSLIGSYQLALENYERAQEYYKSNGLLDGIAKCNTNISKIYYKVGSYEKALERYEAAHEYYESKGMVKEIINSDLAGEPFSQMELHKWVLEKFKFVQDIYNRLELPEEIAQCNLNIGNNLEEIGQNSKTKKLLKKARKYYRSKGLKEYVAICNQSIARILVKHRRYKKAITLFDSALKIYEEIRNNLIGISIRSSYMERRLGCYIDTINCSIKLKDYTKALYFLERSKAKILYELSPFILLNENKVDQIILRLFIKMQQRIINQRVLGSSLEEIGEENDIYTRSIDTKEIIESQSLLNRIFSNSNIDKRVSDYKSKIGIEYLKREEEYIKLLSDDGEVILSFLPVQQGEKISLFCINKQEGIKYLESEETTWDKLLNIAIDLITTYTLLTYNREESNRYLFFHEWSNKLEKMLIILYEEIFRTQFKQVGTLSNYLKKIIKSPLEKVPSLKFIPYGILHLLPFHAACYYDKGEKHYLLEDYVISYAPSCFLLNRMKQMYISNLNKTLVISAPEGSHLKWSIKEGRDVAHCFKKEGYSVEFLEKMKATKDEVQKKLKANRYRFIHFSCHATFLLINPLYSYISLSKLKRDCLLTLREILEHSFEDTEIVVLSSCEGNLIEPRNLDEYFGLAAGFLAKGAKSVLSSMWIVDDESTKKIISDVYKLYLKENMSLDEALRTAQLSFKIEQEKKRQLYDKKQMINHQSLRKEGPLSFSSIIEQNNKWETTVPKDHPLFWAAFICHSP
jgi:CHAT domain-containing protein